MALLVPRLRMPARAFLRLITIRSSCSRLPPAPHPPVQFPCQLPGCRSALPRLPTHGVPGAVVAVPFPTVLALLYGSDTRFDSPLPYWFEGLLV